MKRLHPLPLLFFALLLVLTLNACGTEPSQEPSPPEEESMDTLPEDSTAQPDISVETLRLFLPKDAFFDVVSTVSTQSSNAFTLSIEEDSTASAQAALLDGRADLVVLSPQNAATLYRNGEKVQIVAVIAPGDPTLLDSLSCLVGKADFLSEQHMLLSDFFKACTSAVLRSSSSDAFFATGWNMVDLVQQSLEDQYAQSPDPAHSIPDGAFYYTAN